MTQVVATTLGLYPVPDWAKDELSDLKGHQKEDLIDGKEGEEITATYERIRDEYIESQQEAGLDRIVEGQARWDDMLAHPLAVHENVDTRGIVRYYDNNNFYRDPVVTGDLTDDGDLGTELEHTADQVEAGLQAVVPGPYSLADLATDEHYGDDRTFLDAIAEFLASEVDSAPAVETVFLLEPSLVEASPDGGLAARASEAIDTVASATDAEVALVPYWGALEETVYAHVLDADIDALGYDLVSETDGNLYNVQEYGTTDDVALGVVDGQNTRIESPGTIRDRLDWFQERVPAEDFDTVYATPNTGLFYLPVNRYEEKLEALGAVTEEVVA